MATITAVAALDTLDEGRVKWNTNDTNLNAAIAATDALFATHVGTGTGSGHATYAAYEARIAALEADVTDNSIAISMPFAANVTTYYPIPAGTITTVLVRMATGTIVSKAFTSASAAARTVRLTNDSSGIVVVYVDGSSIGSLAVDDGDALGATVIVGV